MRTYIFILWTCLCCSLIQAQELWYFKEQGNPNVRGFELKERVTDSTASFDDWRMTGVTDMDEKGIYAMKWPIMQELFGDLSGEERDIILQTKYLFFYDRDFKLMNVSITLPVDYTNRFHLVEKRLYEFTKRHADMHMFKPYLTFSGELKGVVIRIPLSWLEKAPR
ncbi:MAG: hypothetical protein LUG96_01400 [Tannerellaceae bacterium]|nr:hypothetical protein [Tannerellaceae bacterium]